ITVPDIPSNNPNLVQRWNVLQPTPEVERIVLSQGCHLSSCTHQILHEMGADETIGAGHEHAFVLKIHLGNGRGIISEGQNRSTSCKEFNWKTVKETKSFWLNYHESTPRSAASIARLAERQLEPKSGAEGGVTGVAGVQKLQN